jgi:hypothetical protein
MALFALPAVLPQLISDMNVESNLPLWEGKMPRLVKMELSQVYLASRHA